VDEAVIIGQGAGAANLDSTANGNVLIGKDAGAVMTSGARNLAIGKNALLANTTSDDNMAIGLSALQSLTTGATNLAIGRGALSNHTTGGSNIAIGVNAMDGTGGVNAEGSTDNIFIGIDAGGGVWGTGAASNYNIGIGNSAMKGVMDGTSYNVCVGHDAGKVITGNGNTCFGHSTGVAIAAGTYSTCVGYAAGYGISSGGNNLLLGYEAGQAGSPSGNITGESSEICLGNNNIGEAHVKVDWTIDSDERDKADIANFTHGLDYVNELRPVNFVWDMRSDYVERQSDEDGNRIPMTEEEIINVVRDGSKKGSDVQLGFIAQEVQAIEDSLGIDNNCIVDTKREDFYKMKSAKMIPVLVNAIKELSDKVEALENA
jgi:hypothetical protein